jgi:hypothetical protein
LPLILAIDDPLSWGGALMRCKLGGVNSVYSLV